MNDLNITHAVTSYECGADHLLKPASFMHFCQEAAETHASGNNLGYEWSISNGMIWVEVQGDFEFVRRPSWKEVVRLRSNTGKASALQARRFVEMSDLEGNVIARADLMWVLIDVNSRRPIPLKRAMAQMPDECPAIISTPLEVAKEFTATASVEMIAPRRDVDFNGHINNGSYLIWALETLPENLQPGPAPRRIRINFKRETFAGAPISIEHRLAGLQTQHSIVSDSELRAEIIIDWQAE